MPRSAAPTPGHVRTPRQERSRATLARILDATEFLLESHLLEEITLGDILRESGVSVGAFYARFSNKEAIVPCLYERYDRRITEGMKIVLDGQRWRGRALSARVGLLFRYSVMLYRREHGLLRALILRARSDPDIVTVEQRQNRAELYEMTARMLLECRDEMTHPDPESAVAFGLLMAGATFREKVLYARAPHPQAVAATDAVLVREMSRAFLGYVGAATPGADG
jgi:AcrR family transcriptional regulator